MRRTFATTLAELATKDERIMLLTGDLGFMALEPFANMHPDRFLNMGVAEQNMIGVAAGLAEAGYIPFCYSIATFASMRGYEFFRNDVIAQRLQVRLVGVGTGFEYGHNGISHYALEDLALMRAQPGLTLIAPADAEQAKTALIKSWDVAGPVYYRLGKDDRLKVPGLQGRFELGGSQTVREGRDLAIVTTGPIAAEAWAAAEQLAAHGVSASLTVVACLNPAPSKDLESVLSEAPLAMSVEGHYLNGGLGSLLAELIAEKNLRTRLVRCGVAATPDGHSGDEQYLLNASGLTAEQLVARGLKELHNG
jgi:transketolase